MSERPEVLRLDGVRVVLGKREVLDVERFAVRQGEVAALLGPNGSGKSTLLRTGALLLEPTAGRVSLFGQEPGSRAERVRLRRRTASVFTDPTLLDMSVRANVETALRIHGVARDERRHRVETWLDRLGISHLATVRPHTLSAGEAQRVALARAFAVEPELLFLDEPFGSLDFETRARLVGELRDLLATYGAAAVVATHDRSEAQLLADRVAILLGGRLEQEGKLSEVLDHPRTAAVAAFLGYGVISSAQLLRLVPALNPLGTVACIPLGATKLVPPGADSAVAVHVLGIRGAGGRVELVCDLGEPVVVEVSLRDAREHPMRKGDLVHVQLDQERIHWLA